MDLELWYSKILFGKASETASRLNLEEALQNSSSKRVDSMPILLSGYLK